MPDILEQTRLALIAAVTDAGTDLDNLYNGEASGDKSLPCGIASAENAVEEPVGTGNFWVDAQFEIRSSAPLDADGTDPKTAHDALAAAVINGLERPDLADELTSSISAYTVYGFGPEKQITTSRDEDTWVTTWRRQIYCCVSDLA